MPRDTLKHRVRAAARGRWREIFCAVGGFDPKDLTGRHGPCPMCKQGKDCFRVFKDFAESGGVYCNKCHDFNNGDGFAALQRKSGKSFPDVLESVAEYLGLLRESRDSIGSGPDSKSMRNHLESKNPADQLRRQFTVFEVRGVEEKTRFDACLASLAKAKPPITVAALRAVGAEVVRWPKSDVFGQICIAFRAQNRPGETTGYLLRRADGKDFIACGRLRARKTHMLRGSADGWVIPGGFERVQQARVVWRVEGIPDALSLFPLLPDDHSVVTNICGAKACPTNLEIFTGKIVYSLGDADKPGQDGARRFAMKVLGIADSVRIVALPYDIELEQGKDLRDYFNEGYTFGELHNMCEAATPLLNGKAFKIAIGESSSTSAIDVHSVPTVEIGTDEHRVNDEAISALAADHSLFQRGGRLVHVVHETAHDGIKRAKDTPNIGPLTLAGLRERLSRAVNFVTSNASGVMKSAHPPKWCYEAVAARGYWPGIRPLTGVVTAPVLRSDGSILDSPGYDPKTGLLFASEGTTFPIVRNPTRKDAVHAARSLLDVVCDFPFAKAEHLSAWMAFLLTTVGRFAFTGPAPLFLIDANVRGSGKSLLCDLVAIIATGREMPRMPNPKDDNECRKRITALALAGDTLCLVDNVCGELGCAALDAALTGTIWKDRLLGSNEITELPLQITWSATGNNVMLQADTSRRVVHVRLNSPLENPEQREGFRHSNVREFAREKRPQLLANALTILSAYFLEGRPRQKLPMWGSFEGWSDLIRQVIVWCDLSDPGKTRTELMEHSDREAIALRNLAMGWDDFDPDGCGVTASDIVDRLNAEPDRHHLVRDSLLELCSSKPGNQLSVRSLGSKLGHLRGRVIGGRYVDYLESRGRTRAWLVRRGELQSGDCGDSGDTSIPQPYALKVPSAVGQIRKGAWEESP